MHHTTSRRIVCPSLIIAKSAIVEQFIFCAVGKCDPLVSILIRISIKENCGRLCDKNKKYKNKNDNRIQKKTIIHEVLHKMI